MNDRPAGSPTISGQIVLRGVVSEETNVSSLILPTEQRDSIVQYLRRCLPHEGVGVLATRRKGSSLTAVRFYPGRNMDRSARRYTMDPADVLPALTDIKREKTRLGAIVHSHPHTSPVPSRTDLVEATIPGVLSLIVSFSPVVELLAWRLVYDGRGVPVRFVEVPVVCRDTSKRAWFGFLRRTDHNRGRLRHSVKGSA
jgi:proteasome lid subunit RPN8/RPN11